MLKRYAVTNTGDIEEHPEGMVVLFDDVEGETYSQAHVDRLHRHREQAYEDVARISAENKALVDKLPSWRIVSDDPPKLGAYVLCYFVGGHVCSCAYAKETYETEPRWYSEFVARMGQSPTHWMPLPEPPK